MDSYIEIQCPSSLRRAKIGCDESSGKKETNEERIRQSNIRKISKKTTKIRRGPLILFTTASPS